MSDDINKCVSISIDYEDAYNKTIVLLKEKKIETDKLYATIKELNDRFEQQYKNEKCCVSKCEPDYEREYYGNSEQIKELQQEVEDYKKALINIALKL